MKIIVEKGVGEIRAAAFDDTDLPVSLFLWRDRRLDPSARLGDVHPAIVRSVDKGRSEVFLELSNGDVGYFNLRNGQPVPDEGAHLNVLIRAEAHDEKAALVRPVQQDVGLLGPEYAIRNWTIKLGDVYADIVPEVVETSREIDAVFDDALSEQVTLPGGGTLYIEQTRALCAVDVDASGRAPSAGEGLNVAALKSLAREIALRRISGTIVVDLAGAPKGERAEALTTLLKNELKALSVTGANILRPSPLGLMEMTLPRSYRPVAEYAAHRSEAGKAAEMLREVLRAGVSDRTAQFDVSIGQDIADFLQKSEFDWASALANRLGNRFSVKTDKTLTTPFLIRPA